MLYVCELKWELLRPNKGKNYQTYLTEQRKFKLTASSGAFISGFLAVRSVNIFSVLQEPQIQGLLWDRSPQKALLHSLLIITHWASTGGRIHQSTFALNLKCFNSRHVTADTVSLHRKEARHVQTTSTYSAIIILIIQHCSFPAVTKCLWGKTSLYCTSFSILNSAFSRHAVVTLQIRR